MNLWLGLDHETSDPIHDWLSVGWYKMQGNMISIHIGRLTLTVCAEWVRRIKV